jgi:predicted RNA-binding Zn ribbon-like protein
MAPRGSARMANDRPQAMFIADSRGLDFLNSIATPVDKPIEFIGCGEDFLTWLRDALLVPAGVLATLQDRAVPGELDDVAVQARALREWFRDFVVEYRGKPLPMNAARKLEPLNQLLARDEEFGQIVPRDRRHGDEAPSQLKWEVQSRWHSPESLLIPIAKAMAELVCSEDFSNIKACQGHTCTLFFLDKTRARARRWCSMAICGNRAKQAAHRKRTKRTRGRRARK